MTKVYTAEDYKEDNKRLYKSLQELAKQEKLERELAALVMSCLAASKKMSVVYNEPYETEDEAMEEVRGQVARNVCAMVLDGISLEKAISGMSKACEQALASTDEQLLEELAKVEEIEQAEEQAHGIVRELEATPRLWDKKYKEIAAAAKKAGMSALLAKAEEGTAIYILGGSGKPKGFLSKKATKLRRFFAHWVTSMTQTGTSLEDALRTIVDELEIVREAKAAVKQG